MNQPLLDSHCLFAGRMGPDDFNQSGAAKAYLIASTARLLRLKSEMVEAKQVTLDEKQLRALPFAALLPGAAAQRLQGYLNIAGCLDNKDAVSACWVDLNQTSTFISNLRDVAPPLLRGTAVYDLVSKRPAVVEELYLSMGFPCPLDTEDPVAADELQRLAARYWPFQEWSRDGIPERAKAMIGNAMHVNCIGVALTLALCLACMSAEQASELEAALE